MASHGFGLLGARAVGGAHPPVSTTEHRRPLPSAGSITVGVIDTGVALNSEGRPHAWFGHDHLSFCPAEDEELLTTDVGERASADGHGTFVAGVVVREAPTARIRAWGVLGKARVPPLYTEFDDDDDVAVSAALAALALNPQVRVINLSFGGGGWETKQPILLKRALHELVVRRPDIVVVAAAGNNTNDRDDLTQEVWPAAFCKHLPNVIAVGAVDESKRITVGTTPAPAKFSNEGDWITAFASGVDLLGPLPYPPPAAAADPVRIRPEPSSFDGPSFDGWARWSGTSFASAVVSGRIAQACIEHGINGVDAWEVVKCGSQMMDGRRARWVRSVDTPPFVPVVGDSL